MAIPRNPTPYAMQSASERIVDNFSKLESPSQSDLNRVKTEAQVHYRIEAYRKGAQGMEISEIESEKHLSARMAQHLEDSGDERPHPKCHAHAIVAGKHPNAVELRSVLAWAGMRIDDPANGCWLPENTAAKALMPPRLKQAVPHSRIHRFNYYFWLGTRIGLAQTPDFEALSKVLKLIEQQLQNSAFPDYVMNRKGVGLPA